MINQKAFSIVELLVVISVLATLIGIAIPTFKGMKDAATKAQVQKELQTLQSATESYYMFTNPNAYPGTAGAAISTSTQSTYLVSAVPAILPSTTPLYDPWGATSTTEYRYQKDSGGKYYVWFSVGPNGTFAGCFVAGTKVELADGQQVSIEQLKVGDMLLGSQGVHNKILDLKVLPKMKRKIYSFNSGRYFVTEDHPFMTKKGWASINPKLSKHENPQLKVIKLKTGEELVLKDSFVRLNKIEFKGVKDSIVYSLELDGNHTYYANGFLVHNPVVVTTQYINTSGVVTRSGDDICVTNGSGC